MERSRSLLDQAAIIRTATILVATCALVLASAVGAVAQSPDATAAASMAPASTAPESPAAPATIGPECAKDQLTLKNPGRLTLSTDNPAYPPWWGGTPPDGSEWALGYPPSGEGYEGATAAAVAAALGFTAEEVDWIPNAVFENAFAPGPKAFDYHMAQISIRPERAEAVDFSDPYFDANQSVIAMTSLPGGEPAASGEAPAVNPILAVTTIEGLKAFRLGAAVGTTSLQLIESVIQPTESASVFNDNAAAVQALQNGQVDAIVADLQSAFFMRDAQLENFDTPDPEATVVGQFDVSAQVDQMGIVLEKDSPLTACVNQALAVIQSDGTLDAIYDQWISTGQEIPFFQ